MKQIRTYVQRAFLYCLLIVVCVIFTLAANVRSDTYTWVDEKGVRHFSDSPPPGSKADKIEERPIVKTPVSTTEAEGYSEDQADLENSIQYYEEEISDSEKQIEDYGQKIREMEDRKQNLQTHRMGHTQKDYYTNLKKQLESDIERYRGLIDDIKKKIVEYRNKITVLKGELAISQLTPEKQEAPEQKLPEQKAPELKPPKTILYHGDIEIHVFHQPGCSYYDCENCIAIFNDREEAISSGYQPCNICNP